MWCALLHTERAYLLELRGSHLEEAPDMSPFLQGFFTCALIEGVIYTVVWIVRRYRETSSPRNLRTCPYCNGELREDGRGYGALEYLNICDACGDTQIKKEHRL
jgi:hypothetical protein